METICEPYSKEEQVASLKRTFEMSEIVLATHYSGMTMQEMTDLRSRMLEAGASFKVTKNRLTRLALQNTDFESLMDLLINSDVSKTSASINSYSPSNKV